MFLSLSPTINIRASFLSPRFLGTGEILSAICIGAYGVKTYFKASEDWKIVWSGRGSKNAILERCVFKSSKDDVYLVADAYEGSQIKMAVTDFLSAAAGVAKETVSFKIRSEEVSFAAAGDADVIVYVGHDAFMDFQIPPIAGTREINPVEQ